MEHRHLPKNRPLAVVSPWLDVLVDPDGDAVGWDGPIFGDAGSGLGPLQVSTQSRGREVKATVTEDTRRL